MKINTASIRQSSSTKTSSDVTASSANDASQTKATNPFDERFAQLPTTMIGDRVGRLVQRTMQGIERDLLPKDAKSFAIGAYAISRMLGDPTGLAQLMPHMPFVFGMAPEGAAIVADAGTYIPHTEVDAPRVEAWGGGVGMVLPARAEQLYDLQFLRDGINCHGVAAYVAGLTDLRYVGDSELNFLIKMSGGEPISADEARPGDLFQIRTRYTKNMGRLGPVVMEEGMHTAVVAGDHYVYSKDGATRAAQPEIESYRKIFDTYPVDSEYRDGVHHPDDSEMGEWVVYYRLGAEGEGRDVWAEIKQDPRLAEITEFIEDFEGQIWSYMMGDTDGYDASHYIDDNYRLMQEVKALGIDPDLETALSERIKSIDSALTWNQFEMYEAPKISEVQTRQYGDHISIYGTSEDGGGSGLSPARVEVQIDDGEWIRAQSVDNWSVFVPAEPGEHQVKVRARDPYGGAGPTMESTFTMAEP